MTGPGPEVRAPAAPPAPRGGRKTITTTLLEQVSPVLARSDLMGILFVVVLAALLVPGGRLGVPITPLGEVATRDVLAPMDFQVPDEAATEREREKRADEVPLAFDYDGRQLQAALDTVARIFEVGRRRLPEVETYELSRSDDVAVGGSGSVSIDPALLVLLDQPDLPAGVPPELLSVLRSHRFDQAHQDSIERVLRAVLGKHISTLPSDRVEEFQGRPIVARNVVTGEELKVRGIEEIFSPDQARRFLASELAFQESDLWERSSRQVLESYLASLPQENFTFNEVRYQRLRREAAENVPLLYTEVKKGEKIVGRGELVGYDEHRKLEALRTNARTRWSVLQALGVVLLLSLFAYGLWRYVDYHQESEKKVNNLYAMVVLTFLASAVAVNASITICLSLVERFQTAPYNVLEPYLFLAPYAVGSLLLTLLVDSEIAMVFAVTFSLIAGLIAKPSGDYTVALYALIAGFGAIYFTGPYLKRTTVLQSGLAVGVAASITVLGVSLQRGTWNDPPLLLFSVVCAFGSGLLASAVVQLLLPIFETLFGILTDLKLSELMSANHPLISELALRAPGTYNHSIIVGTLAEGAAKSIGVSPVFMRAAAYYHDIGKMKMPEYFIENQQGAKNRHDKLAPSLSSLIVKSHVKDGIEMGRAHGLPEELIEMIPAHHGTRMLAYFYRKAKALEDSSLSPVKESDYRYPGPRPRNKEGGLMMLCDAVEAAARSLEEPTSQKFQNVIDKMVETIYLDGQLDETDLTLKDLQAIRGAFHKVLLSIYHHRIHYPGFDFDRRDKKSSRTPRSIPEGDQDQDPARAEPGSRH